jgi:hypothetical protein
MGALLITEPVLDMGCENGIFFLIRSKMEYE